MQTPRLNFAHLPTPIEELPNLSKALNGPRIFVKRDDQTGLAFGGNKTRKLEFLIAEAREQGADLLISGGAMQLSQLPQGVLGSPKYESSRTRRQSCASASASRASSLPRCTRLNSSAAGLSSIMRRWFTTSARP